jgi:hypothetical protein
MFTTEIYKTAHVLLVKHGDSLIDALDEKLQVYSSSADTEAVAILGRIRMAAEQLMMHTAHSTMAH